MDDQSQDRVRLEAQAVLSILNRILNGEYSLVSSESLFDEILQGSNQEHVEGICDILQRADAIVFITDTVKRRAATLEHTGFDPYDALHLACAEAGKADVFMTTDDRLAKLAKRASISLELKVVNPVQWLMERTS